MASISVVNFTGRLFDKPVSAGKDGLVALINYAGGLKGFGTH